MSEDKIEGMSYKHKDPNTGEEKVYEVSYSQILQKKIDEDLIKVKKEIRWSNYLKVGMIIGLVLLLILGYLIFTETGTVGYYLRLMVCPVMI